MCKTTTSSSWRKLQPEWDCFIVDKCNKKGRKSNTVCSSCARSLSQAGKVQDPLVKEFNGSLETKPAPVVAKSSIEGMGKYI